ncbi:MAG: hypothetical protein IT200_11060 [Thermoleophilia bacterium]|nr:hypothetical protein [Thermoleophilia bacterium]
MTRRLRRGALIGGAALAAAAMPAAGAQFHTYTLLSAHGKVTYTFNGGGVGTHIQSEFPFTRTGTINGTHTSTWSFVGKKVGRAPLQRQVTFSPSLMRAYRTGARAVFDTTLIAAFGPVRSTSSTQITGVGGDGVTRTCAVTASQPAGARLSPSEYFLHGARQGGVLRLTMVFVDNELRLTSPNQDPACEDALRSVTWRTGTETFAKVAASKVAQRRIGRRVTLVVTTTTPLLGDTDQGAPVQVGTLTQRSVFVLRLKRVV